MPPPYRPPIETVATGRAYRLAEIRKAVLAGTLASALLGGDAILTWAEALPVHAFSDRVVHVAAAWRDLSRSAGLTGPAEFLRVQFHRLRDHK
jgi:hypothetical protein